jgi:hypothetical protein
LVSELFYRPWRISDAVRLPVLADAAVQRSHHSDPGKHRWPVIFGNEKQAPAQAVGT